MMKIEAKTMEAFCNILTALIHESRLTITEKDGIITRAVDTANVALVQVTLPPTAFTEYKVEKCQVGMDVHKWKGAIGVMKADATVTIEIPKDGRITLSDGGYDYKITPLDCNTIRKDPNVPGFQLPNALEIESKEYIEAIRALAIIGDKIKFTISGSSLELAAEGDTDFLKKEIPGERPAGKKNETAASSLFSIEYLKEITKGLKHTDKVTIHLGIDHPVRFDFMAGEIEASYVIAPRIEQGE
jgi:proliferating cell nuclear antigen